MVTTTQLLPIVKQVESGGNPMALSPKGAAGAYQIMPQTAANPGYGVTPLQGWDGRDPRTAPPAEQERFANDYLQAMAALHGGDVKLALASYNAGPGAVEAAGNTVPNYPETQNYVKKITAQGAPVAETTISPGNTATDWRTRAQAVDLSTPQVVDAGTGWRANAQPVSDTSMNWKNRAQPVETPGTDMGAGTAAVQGFNSAIPFGERIAAGLGAGGAYLYNKATGLDGGSLSDYYKEGRQNQEKTAQANPGSYTAGAVGGIAATLPALSTKVLTGEKAVTGVRGAINAVPEALGAVGNYVRGGQVAAEAGTAAKLANVGGKALRAAAVSAPTGALYGYGGSRSDLNSQGAVDDAKTGAAISAALGAAVPVAGAALSKIPKPNVSQAVKDLAATAKDKFGIDLSLDQIAPSNVRNTVQKISQNIPGSGVDAFQEKQATQWMKGVAKTIGEDADNLSPEVINNYLARASKDFETPLAGKTIDFTPEDIDAIKNVVSDAKRKISNNLSGVVEANVGDFINNVTDKSTKALKENDYVYHGTMPKNISSIVRQGLKPSTSGMEGKGAYFSKTPDGIYSYVDNNSAVLRVKKTDLIDKYGSYHYQTNKTGKVYGMNTDPSEDVLVDYAAGNIPANMFEIKTANGWEPLVKSNNTSISGEKLASLRSQILKDLPSIEGGARQQVAKIIDKIDEVVGRHLTPAENKQLATARLQWRNYRTIEPLLEKSTDGTVNPTQLMQKVASSKYIKASRKATGEDDLVDLARIGKQFMAKKGGSDTAEKIAYMKGAADLGTAAGLIAAPFKVAPALIANRGYQKLINQSPKVVENLVKNKQGASVAVPVANMLGAQTTNTPLKLTIHPEKK